MEFPGPYGEFPGRFESTNLSRDDIGGEIGRSVEAASPPMPTPPDAAARDDVGDRKMALS